MISRGETRRRDNGIWLYMHVFEPPLALVDRNEDERATKVPTIPTIPTSTRQSDDEGSTVTGDDEKDVGFEVVLIRLRYITLRHTCIAPVQELYGHNSVASEPKRRSRSSRPTFWLSSPKS